MDRNEQHGKGVEGGVKGQRGERKEKSGGERRNKGERARALRQKPLLYFICTLIHCVVFTEKGCGHMEAVERQNGCAVFICYRDEDIWCEQHMANASC